MDAKRIRSVLGTRGKYASQRPRRIAARMYLQNAAVGQMQPRHHDDAVSWPQAVQACAHVGLEHQRAIGCILVTLTRSVAGVRQR
jgi:hypothetical protein